MVKTDDSYKEHSPCTAIKKKKKEKEKCRKERNGRLQTISSKLPDYIIFF